MMPVNMRLGFDQMRAAAVGGHDLAEAFSELMEIAARSKDMTVVQGGVACLLACLRLIELHAPIDSGLPGTPFAEFLEMSPIERAERADQLLIDNRRGEIARLAALLICLIKPFTAFFVFKGTLGCSMQIELRT